MLSFIESWLKNLIVIIVLISIVKMVMPTGKIKSYIRFILSLVVMLLIVQPVVDAIKGGDFLVNSWVQGQKTMDFQENRVYTLAQTINNNEDAIALYKQRVTEQLEHDLALLTNQKVQIHEITIVEDINSKQFGYVSDINISVMQEHNTSETTEVMAGDSASNQVMQTEIKKWLTTNFGADSMNIKISLEGEG